MKKLISFLALLSIALTIVAFTTCSMNTPETPDLPLEAPTELSFIVKSELEIFDGNTLLFSEKPIRAQWGFGPTTCSIAFVFPIRTRIAFLSDGEFLPIHAVNDQKAGEGASPNPKIGNSAYELTLTSAMGGIENGIRIISDNTEQELLSILINNVTHKAIYPGTTIIYAWEIDSNTPYPSDDKTLANLLLPDTRLGILSKAPEIVAAAKTITNGINGDYEKARAIHLWVAGNIWYNRDQLDNWISWDEGEWTYNSTYVLRNRRGVCEGYTSLITALLRAVGIPARYISGDVVYNTKVGYENHAWTGAYIGGRWIYMDTTWDSGNRFENGEFSPQQAPGNRWFDMPAEEFAKTHMLSVFADYIIENGLAATGAN